MAKPRLIILIRHAQSEGNKNRDIHQTIPDHRVKLTPLGRQQAHDAGRRLRELLRPEDTLQFFTSPYRRTRETTDGVLETLTAPNPDGAPSPWARDHIKVYEEPRLREQDFGNFQPCSAEMERMWQERADYGHFFYRIPNGESAADAYDRVSGFNESLWRQFGDNDFPSVCVLVTHGLMSRVFLMKWYHFTVEYFEDLRNVNHCEFLIMRKQDQTGKYDLQTKLRTWSELHRERAEKEREKGRERDKEKERDKDRQKLERAKTFIVTRRWGGCPNGCNHGAHYKRRDDLEIMRQRDSNTTNNNSSNSANGVFNVNGNSSHHKPNSNSNSRPNLHSNLNPNFKAGDTQTQSSHPAGGTIAGRRLQQRQQTSYHSSSSSNENSPTDHTRPGNSGISGHPGHPYHVAPNSPLGANGPQIDVSTAADEESASSPDATPSFMTAGRREHQFGSRFNVGRDGGGSYSGVQSFANSDAELSEDDRSSTARPVSAKRGSFLSEVLKSIEQQTTATAARASPDSPRGEEGTEGTEGTEGAEGAEGGKGENDRHFVTVNRLGDAPQGSDGESEGGRTDEDAEGYDDDLVKAEAKDRSIQGSVY